MGGCFRSAFPRRGRAALPGAPSLFDNFFAYARSPDRVMPRPTVWHQSASRAVADSREWNDSQSTPDNPYSSNKDRGMSAMRADNRTAAEDFLLLVGLLADRLRVLGWRTRRKASLSLVVAGVIEEAAGAGGVVDAAGAEASQGGNGLVRSAAAFADHVEHLASHVEGHHAVAAHRG